MINVKQNDTRPAAYAVLRRGDTVVDLTAASTVTFKMRAEDGTLKVDAAAVILAPLTGEVEYRWATGDTDTPGLFPAEWQVSWLDNTVETFPTIDFDYVTIHGDLDS